MTQYDGTLKPSVDPKSIKIKSSTEPEPGIDPPEGNTDVDRIDAGRHDEAEVDIDFSRPFQGYDWSDHPNVNRLIDEIYAEYEVWYREDTPGQRIRNRSTVRQYLTHFVLEAYRVHRAQPGMMLGVHLGKNHYKKGGDRYHRKHISSYRVIKNVTDFLVAADYLELPFGKSPKHPDPKRRRTTRYRATAGLIDLCNEHSINPYMIVPYEDSEVIILRAKRKYGQSQGDPVDYTETPFTRRSRKNLRKINKFIAGHNINLDITDDQERDLLLRLLNRDDPTRDRYLDFTKTRMTRIFNNSSFEQGGRFYGGWWQPIFGKYRVLITINGKRTVQLDYSGMHFAIMYADLGLDIPMDDPYTLTGYGEHLRGHIKKALNIIVNCADRDQAIGTIDGRIKDGKLSAELGDGDRLIQAFIAAHPLIEHKIASGEGVRGQFTDSQIAERILLKGIDIGLCILPIHDGFITTAGDEFVLEGLMNEAFTEVTGFNADIKPETFDLSVLPDAGKIKPYWITRSDGHVEQDGTVEGKATSFSRAVTGSDLLGMIVDAEEKKKNTARRDREWKSAHGQ